MPEEESNQPEEPQKKDAPPSAEQPEQDNGAAAKPTETPAEPKTGVAAVAEAVKEEAGKGLFFPSADKIKERASKRAASDTPKIPPTTAEAPPQHDTPYAAPAEGEAEVEPAEETEEEPIHRPPPPSAPEAKPSPPQPPPKPKKKPAGIGSVGITALLVPYTDRGATKHKLEVYNLSEKDVQYLTFMCNYLADVERQYIPVAHPTYLVKFALNFLLQAIKEELHEAGNLQAGGVG